MISKFMTSQDGQQIIKIYILPNISRSEGNQAMEFGQLLEYNMRKWGRESSSRPFFVF